MSGARWPVNHWGETIDQKRGRGAPRQEMEKKVKGTRSTKAIGRMWHGIASKQNLPCILEALSSSRLRGSLDAKGNLGGLLLSRESNGAAEVYVLTLWESEEAIRGFAGDDLHAPAYRPGDEKYVVSQEPHVKYFDAATLQLDEGSRRPVDLIGSQTP